MESMKTKIHTLASMAELFFGGGGGGMDETHNNWRETFSVFYARNICKWQQLGYNNNNNNGAKQLFELAFRIQKVGWLFPKSETKNLIRVTGR